MGFFQGSFTSNVHTSVQTKKEFIKIIFDSIVCLCYCTGNIKTEKSVLAFF